MNQYVISKIPKVLKIYILKTFIPFSNTLEIVKYSKLYREELNISIPYYYFSSNYLTRKKAIPHDLLSIISKKLKSFSINEIEKKVCEYIKAISKRILIEVDFNYIFDRKMLYELDNNIILHIKNFTESLKIFLEPIMSRKIQREKIKSIRLECLDGNLLNALNFKNIEILEIYEHCNEKYVKQLLNTFEQIDFNLKKFVIFVKLNSSIYISNFLRKTINLEKISLRIPSIIELEKISNEINSLSRLKMIYIIIEYNQIKSFFCTNFPFEKIKKMKILIEKTTKLMEIKPPKELNNLEYLEIFSNGKLEYKRFILPIINNNNNVILIEK